MFTLLTLLAACGEKRIAHGGPSPLFPLVGAHATLPCSACHGPGEPEAQPTTCIECHAEDAPPGPPPHYPGEDCGGCHDQIDWANLLTLPTGPTGPTGPTETGGDTGTTPTDPTGFVHIPTQPDDLCWTCHEEDRKDPGHNSDAADVPEGPDDPAKRWDCSPCHVQETWATSPVQHPVRTPHGAKAQPGNPDVWIVACTDCHASGPPAFDCTPCHGDIFVLPQHSSLDPVPESSPTCLTCHPIAE